MSIVKNNKIKVNKKISIRRKADWMNRRASLDLPAVLFFPAASIVRMYFLIRHSCPCLPSLPSLLTHEGGGPVEAPYALSRECLYVCGRMYS